MNDNTIMACAYCGRQYLDGTPTTKRELLTEHIKICEKHPMREAEQKIDRLRNALAGFIGASTKEELGKMEIILRSTLNNLLTRFGDREETIYSAELYLLRRIAETSSDMVKARDWPEFRAATGGQKKLDKAHEDALREYVQWLSEGEG